MSNYEVITTGDGVEIRAWTRGVEFEDAAKKQVANVASLPFVFHHVAVMPDVHWGMGATVGSVIATRGAIVPAAVGVDIGCGMIAQPLGVALNDLPSGSLPKIRAAIEQAVPHGRTDNGGPNDRGAWRNPADNPMGLEHYEAGSRAGLERITRKHQKLNRASRRAPYQLGTLGTGNHFIEVCHDQRGDLWLMLHSGSRGIGNAIGTYFIERARQRIARESVHLPDRDLAWLEDGTEDFRDYVEAVQWAQDFAAGNRELMMQAILRALAPFHPAIAEMAAGKLGEAAVNCHHNYVTRETHFGQSVWLTRKGAVRARAGDLGIIPGSMGVKSFIVRGKGNPDSFQSCSHGAGRRMSRGEARRRFTVEDHVAATTGVECRKDKEVLDETPAAYKSIDAVMAAQSDLVEIVHTLKQVVCVKG